MQTAAGGWRLPHPVSTKALKLYNDYYAFEARGVRPPDPEPYRVDAEALRSEQSRLGCPGELLAGFSS